VLTSQILRATVDLELRKFGFATAYVLYDMVSLPGIKNMLGRMSVAASEGSQVTASAPRGRGGGDRQGLKTCKFCKRSDLTPNPLDFMAEELISWRREHGHEFGGMRKLPRRFPAFVS
jgi:hypothetical protein